MCEECVCLSRKSSCPALGQQVADCQSRAESGDESPHQPDTLKV